VAEPTRPPPHDDIDVRLAERMAAQIDGTSPNGAAFLDGLSDDDLALFAEAAAIQHEMEAEELAATSPRVVSIDRARKRRVNWLGIAAVVAAVALVPLIWRTTRGGAIRAPSQAVAMLSSTDAGLPPGRPWTTRGETNVLSDRARAVRLGAYAVDLELAIRQGNVKRRQSLAGDAQELMVQDGGIAASGFLELGTSASTDTGELLAVLERATDTALDYLDREVVALGAWGEAARISAGSRDAAFFRHGRTRGTLRAAERALRDDDAALAAIQEIRDAAEGDPPDWGRLRAAVDALLGIS